jgi:hypothetical protein
MKLLVIPGTGGRNADVVRVDRVAAVRPAAAVVR